MNSAALQPASVRWLLAALGVAFLPHLGHLHPVAGIACLMAGLWRWQACRRGWPLPGKALRMALTLATLGLVYLLYGTLLGRDAGTALLALMMGLKLLEMRRPRDAGLVVALAYFLTVTLALYSQALPLLLYQVLALLLITASLLQLHHGARPAPAGALLGRACRMLLQALPVMLVLFLLFPRLPGPLWGGAQGSGGSGGLDDSMSPGSISALGQSDAVAFRVQFEGGIPDNSLLYWRGPVLWYTDGRGWRATDPDRPIAVQAVPTLMLRGKAVRYHVTLEPQRRRWLYALDLPTLIPPGSHRSADLLLLSDRPLDRVTRYTTASHLHYRTGPLSPEARRRALQLPPHRNPRTLALGAAWAGAGGGGRAVVQQALNYFRDQPFHYTLKPPLLDGADPVDQFLFQTRRGFCEHYAAAFTVLMRAAGIPARVVTGYQGGEVNPVGHYLIVRQRDAHAWAEVWLKGEGWVRVDPTAAVAPQRIERGIDSALKPELESGLTGTGALAPLWRRLRYGVDALNNGWNQWVLGYGPRLQQQLLTRWGLETGLARALALMGGLTLALTVVALWLWHRRRVFPDALETTYRRFCRKLARHGLGRRPSEGPLDFADRIRKARPDLTEAQAISRLYATLRYGPAPRPDGLEELRRRVRRFRP